MKKIIISLSLILGLSVFSSASDYNAAIGLRGGFGESGLTYKQFMSRSAAFEGLLHVGWGGFGVTGLYEIHQNAFDVDRLNWYYGFGAHLGMRDGTRNPYSKRYDYTYFGLGIDGIIGIEYCFIEAPINISLDIKPAIDIIEYFGPAGGAGVSIRYMF